MVTAISTHAASVIDAGALDESPGHDREELGPGRAGQRLALGPQHGQPVGDEVFARPGVAERVAELGAEGEPLPGPTRAELLSIVAG